MIVAGVMSGTSADGVDVALCRIGPGRTPDASPRVQFLGAVGFPYPRALRAELFRVMEGQPLPAAEMSCMNWRLGEIYAECVHKAAAKYGIKVALVGCHGQTIHHQPTPVRYLGAPVRSTWQTGEPAVIAERMRCPVVSDFRPADLAADGQGAPLVPMLDWCLFRSAKASRVLLNLGGIANLTAIPAGGDTGTVLAFDSGPANMVIDHCMMSLFGKKFDRHGNVAQRGCVLPKVLTPLLLDRYFSVPPPKSCGREQFGAAYATRLIAACGDAGASDADCVATATALTAESILAAYQAFVAPHLQSAASLARVELYAAGGGTKNRTLMAALRQGLTGFAVQVRSMDDLGVPARAKEAVAFALLAWLTWNGLPGNIPSATGADRPAILGKVSYG